MLTPDPYRDTPLGVECAWPASASADVALRKESRMKIDLRRGTLFRVPRGAGKTVTAQAGSVWITEQGSLRDVILRAGESLRLARRGLALVEAFNDASISLGPTRAR